jgi:hypothetical protein
MKKSLLWLLSSLAISGLFVVAACDDDEEEVDPATYPCTHQTECDESRCVVDQAAEFDEDDELVSEGRYHCCAANEVARGGVCETAGSGGGSGDQCNDDNDCDYGFSCVSGSCVNNSTTTNYRFVKIEDLSTACDKKNCGFDPGADIDAVVLVKSGNVTKYAKRVVGYQRSDGKSVAERGYATDATKALRAPDSFINYPIADQCNYFHADVPGNDKDNREFTFVSLGGKGGWLELEMDDIIEAGDKLDILELGKCALYNTESHPGKLDGGKAQSEQIQVSISVAENNGVWVTLSDNGGKLSANDTNKGILSFKISSADLK